MRGCVIACFGSGGHAGATPDVLARAAGGLRWHTGQPEEYVDGPLVALMLTDDEHGPRAERLGGRSVIAHGCPPRPLAELVEVRERFAALEWDGGVLRVIRDPIGEVPMFYRRWLDAVWFSTEIPPLVALGSANPDLEAITATATGYPFARRTGWRGICRVLPGEILEVDQRLAITARRYWDPARNVGSFRGTPAQAAAEFRRHFEIAVGRCLGTATGVLLSGGLDSSSVAVVAARLRSPATKPALVGVGYPSVPEVDETRYARAVAGTAGLPLTWLDGRLDRWDPGMEALPLGVPGVALPTGVMDTALPALAAQGCDVVLDGHDGDGVLGFGHAPLANTLLDLRLRLLAQVVERSGHVATLRTLASELLPPSLRLRRLRGRRTVRQDIERDLPYFRGRVRERFLHEFGWRPPRSGWRYQQIRIVLPPFVQHMEELESLGARYGVDIRHPFADRDLVEFMLSLPHSVKASPAFSKPVLREGLADLLPPLVRDRRDKSEFSPVVDRRVDYGSCLDMIEGSGVRLPDVDYDRLFHDPDPARERCAWIRLTRAHLFASGAAA